MGKLAVVFSGQGAQFAGMGRELRGRFPACASLYEQANAALGYDLAAICFEGPDAELTKSHHCQPGIFLTSIACFTALKSLRPELAIAATAGLSLGEWTALHVAGVLGFDDTLTALAARGRFMQAACEARAGGMLSVIGLDREQLESVCKQTGCSIANLNSPAQTVLSGPIEAIATAETAAKARGAKRALPLQVAGAFHSPLMESAVPPLAAVLEGLTFNEPSLPVVANVTARPHGAPDAIRDAMLRQVTSPVRWYESIEWMTANGIDTIIECGPGAVLTGLIKRIVKDVTLYNVQSADDAEKVAEALS